MRARTAAVLAAAFAAGFGVTWLLRDVSRNVADALDYAALWAEENPS